MENDLWWKINLEGRRPLMEDNLWWKTTFYQRQLLNQNQLNFVFISCYCLDFGKCQIENAVGHPKHVTIVMFTFVQASFVLVTPLFQTIYLLFFCPLAQVIVKLQDILKEQVCNNFEHFSWSFWVYVGLFRSILFHLIVSWSILVYLGLFQTISCFFRLYLAISGHLGLSRTISGYPQLSWAILGYIRISLAISGYLYQVSRCK